MCHLMTAIKLQPSGEYIYSLRGSHNLLGYNVIAAARQRQVAIIISVLYGRDRRER
jgi:hypothetical protein